jgi:hypothetical protein
MSVRFVPVHKSIRRHVSFLYTRRAVDQLQRPVAHRLGLLPLRRRIQVGVGVAVPAAVLDVDVVPAGTLHPLTVEVLRPRMPQFDAGVDEGPRHRVGIVSFNAGHPQRTAVAGQRIGVVLLILQLLKIGQHVVVGPTRAAVVGPEPCPSERR